MNDMTELTELQSLSQPITQPISAPIMLNDSERQPCEIWTRVMGYHRPVSSFNIGKKGEFHERRFFEEASTHLDA